MHIVQIRKTNMPSETVVTVASVLQSSIPILSLSAYIPQWRKLMRTKSSKDISLRAWLLWSLTSSFATFYAIVQYQVNGRGLPLVFSTAASLVFILATVYFILLHRGSRSGA
jgi:uncharacterized protein with PQ loop repeat